VTKGVGQTKDVIIYDQFISKIFEDAVMGEYNALQIINFSSIIVNGVSPVSLLIFMTFIFTTKIGNLSYPFRIIPLVISFDRDRVYC